MKPQINQYLFKEGLDVEIEVIPLNSLITKQQKVITVPHRTEFYHIFWFQKGNPTHIIDFEKVKTEPNSLLFINKGRINVFDLESGYDGKVLIFTDNFFCKAESDKKYLQQTILFNDLLDIPSIDLTNASPQLQTVFEAIEQELQNPYDQFKADIVRQLLYSFLLLADREKRKQGFREIKKNADFDYTLLFKDLTEQQFTHNKTVGKYAAQMTITEKRLNQATTNVLGISPKQLIDERVILETKRLLAYTNDTIKEICYAIGFEEPTNFIKYFRKHTQTTPVEFREQFRLD